MDYLSLPANDQRLQNRRRSSIMDYEQSHILGHYREDLVNFALTQAEKIVQLREERKSLNDETSVTGNNHQQGKAFTYLKKLFKSGGDMLFFSVLALSLAMLSFSMDVIVKKFFGFRKYLITSFTGIYYINYLIWICFTVTMVFISALITQAFSPQAGGSGISEMKVILRGVVLKEYLTFKTLIAKVIGLCFTLGSGIPLGKEGPFVHISSIVANQLMKLFSNISNPHQYEARFTEIIAVACSIGVAVTFASPIGGVLFSIEIVSVFFSVTSYWHGFFSSVVAALFWRLLSVWFEFSDNITHVFKTDFRLENPYETFELVSFALLGVFCGFSAFIFIKINSIIVKLNRRNTRLNAFFKQNPIVYTLIVTLIVAIVSWPGAFGKYYASWLNSEESIHQLFTNFTWTSSTQNYTAEQMKIINNWQTSNTSVLAHLFLFNVMNIIIVAVVATLPIPLGLIAPSLKIGAGQGRLVGELIVLMFPNVQNIQPGTYAVAGSAAFAGANTGALSTAVMAFEYTGQICGLLPLIVSVLSATMTASLLGPSIYDSLIILKKLPYLPPILPSSSSGNHIFVEDFMNKNINVVWPKCTYRYVRHLLNLNKKFRMYPFVKSIKNKILLGTVERGELAYLLDQHLNREKMKFQLKQSLQNLNNFKITVNEENNNLEIEISSVEAIAWEEKQLDIEVDFTNCPLDPAPFQLMEGTSLLKVHNLFSLLGLQLAFVCSLGTVVGVVSLKELRLAIEGMNSGQLPLRRPKTDINNEYIKDHHEIVINDPVCENKNP